MIGNYLIMLTVKVQFASSSFCAEVVQPSTLLSRSLDIFDSVLQPSGPSVVFFLLF